MTGTWPRSARRTPSRGRPQGLAARRGAAASGAWLTTVARNRAIDRLRRRAVGRPSSAKRRSGVLPNPGAAETDDSGVPDDRLRLIFTCCHPALPLEARVALTLRTLAGLTTRRWPGRSWPRADDGQAPGPGQAEDPHAGIPYRVPPGDCCPSDNGVLGVLYCCSTRATRRTGAELVRQDLSAEAIRLAQVLDQLMPDEPRPRACWR